MVNVKEVPTDKLIAELASRLEKVKEMSPPGWAPFVKTGRSRERPPTQANWWYLRSASILRKIYLHPGLGVNRLRKVYGGRKNLGHQPEHVFPASGSIIRRSVQKLETAGLLKAEKSNKGKIIKRVVSEKGRELMEDAVKSIGR